MCDDPLVAYGGVPLWPETTHDNPILYDNNDFAGLATVHHIALSCPTNVSEAADTIHLGVSQNSEPSKMAGLFLIIHIG